MRSGAIILGILYLIVGLYFINYPFQLINTSSLSAIEPWIILLGGILVLLGAINHFRVRRYAY